MNVVHESKSTPLLCGFLVLAGCGGGSGGSDAPPPSEATPPTATVHFPPEDSLLERQWVTVRGTASDFTGVAAVRVNGLAASSSNGFLDWEVLVHFAATSPEELATLTVETEDVLGNVDLAAAQLQVRVRQWVFLDVADAVFSPVQNKLLVMDGLADVLVVADQATGELTPLFTVCLSLQPPILRAHSVADYLGNALVTDAALDTVIGIPVPSACRSEVSDSGGSPTYDLAGIVYDPFVDMAYVVNNTVFPGQASLLAIDLPGGQRSVFSGPSNAGLPIQGGGGIDLDQNRGRALVAAAFDGLVMAVDLTSGDRTPFSSVGQGTGPFFLEPTDVAVDAVSDLAYVTDRSRRAVFAVDLSSGNRSILSDDANGVGAELVDPLGVTIDPLGRPVVADAGLDALVEIDPVTGDRTVIPGGSRGAGPKLRVPAGVAKLRFPDGDYLVVDREASALLGIDPFTGDRAVLSDSSNGSGPALDEPLDVDVDTPFVLLPDRVYVTDAGLRAILLVDPVTGDRQVVSDDVTGGGPAFVEPVGFDLEQGLVGIGHTNSAFVLDAPRLGPAAIVQVDLDTGDRAILSDAVQGAGPLFDRPTALLHDPYSTPLRLLVVDSGLDNLLAVDLTSGDRSVVSAADPAIPFGDGPCGAIFELLAGRILIADAAGSQIVAVDPTTGARTLLTDPVTGTAWLGQPTALYIGDLELAVAVDQRRGALFSVDLVTGQRALRSK